MVNDILMKESCCYEFLQFLMFMVDSREEKLCASLVQSSLEFISAFTSPPNVYKYVCLENMWLQTCACTYTVCLVLSTAVLIAVPRMNDHLATLRIIQVL